MKINWPRLGSLFLMSIMILAGFQNCSEFKSPQSSPKVFSDPFIRPITDLLLNTTMGAAPRCPAGYEVSYFESHSSCTDSSGATGVCTESRCVTRAPQSSSNVLVDVQFINHAVTSTPTCPAGYALPQGLGTDISFTVTFNAQSSWTYTCLKFEPFGQQTSPVIGVYTSSTSCRTGDTSFSGLEWRMDDQLYPVDYCLSRN